LNPALFIVFFLLLFVIIPSQKQKALNVKRIIKKRKKRGIMNMNEIFQKYIDKDCVIYISNGTSSAIEAKVSSVTDNWLSVQTKDGEEAINIDYIVRIKEHPLTKSGKKKTIIT